MKWNLLKKCWQSQFGSQELLQLILQQEQSELLDADQKRINQWVDRDYLRKLAYQNFTILLKYKRRVEDAHGDVREVLKDLHKIFPKPFSEINGTMTEFTLRKSLTTTLDQAMFQMAHLVVYGFKWLTIIILILRMVLLLLVCLVVITSLK